MLFCLSTRPHLNSTGTPMRPNNNVIVFMMHMTAGADIEMID